MSALPNPIYIVYEVNCELEGGKFPICGTFLSAHSTEQQANKAAGAGGKAELAEAAAEHALGAFMALASGGGVRAQAAASVAAAAQAASLPRLGVRKTSIPTSFVYDGPQTHSGTLMEQLAAAMAPPQPRKPTPLVEAAVWVLTLNGDIGDGVQAVFATKDEATAYLQDARDKDLAVDSCPGFAYVSVCKMHTPPPPCL